MNTKRESGWDLSAARIAQAMPLHDTIDRRRAHHATALLESTGYSLRRAAPPPPSEEIETDDDAVEVRVYWGTALLHVAHLDARGSFAVGESGKVDFAIASESLGAARAVLFEAGAVCAIAGAKLSVSCDDGEVFADFSEQTQVPLSRGMRVRQTVGALVFEVGGVKRGKKTRRALVLAALAGGAMLHVLAAGVAVAGMLGAVAAFTPELNSTGADEITNDQRYLIQSYIDGAAEKEREEKPAASLQESNANQTSGGNGGEQAKGSEGTSGDPNSDARGKRWAARGNASDVKLSRAEAIREAQDFGMVGLLNSGMDGDPNAPTVRWGGLLTEGQDPLSARGNMWSDEIGASHGHGLGLSGIGEGGGSRGEGMGMGPIGTYGHGGGWGSCVGVCNGFGPGGRISGSHKTKAPSMTVVPPSVSGRIPPEVIQRTVRMQYGLFRACYETGLRNNPALRGSVTVQFVIGRDGQVSNAGGGGDLPDAGVVSCVTRAFSGLSFTAPENGIVRVGYSIQFVPGG
jgi:hypothetical protein